MNIREFYLYIDEDFNDFLFRLPNVSSIEKFVRQFGNDPNFDLLSNAIRDNDIESARSYALALKGICLNLGFRHMATAITSFLNTLSNSHTISEECVAKMADIAGIYTNIIEGINRLDV